MLETQEKNEVVEKEESDLEFWIRKIATDGGSKIVPTIEELNAFAQANGLISIEDADEAQYAAMQLVFLGVDTGEVEKARKSFYKAQNLMKKERKKAARRPRFKKLEMKRMVAEIPEVRNLVVYLGIIEKARRVIDSASFGPDEDDEDDDDFLDVEFFDK